MSKKRRKPTLPRVSLLETTKVNVLIESIADIKKMADRLADAIPMLQSLAELSRSLMAYTSVMHRQQQQRNAEMQQAAARRSARAVKANQTRRRNSELRGDQAGGDQAGDIAEKLSAPSASEMADSPLDGSANIVTSRD